MSEARDSIVRIENVSVHFPRRRGFLGRSEGVVQAVDSVSFDIPQGKTVSLVGESGSGKTTTGRAMLGLTKLATGSVEYFGRNLSALKAVHGDLPRMSQLVFQDPYASLNPRLTIGECICEVLKVHRIVAPGGENARMLDLLDAVGLRRELAERHPYALSGGQRQRAAIARALAVEPRFMVLDEVVSALDVSIQGQILNLLQDLQRDRGLTYLFITHDLSVVRHVSHSVVVLYGGQVMEVASRDAIFAAPRHPYTAALLAAVPIPDPRIARARRSHVRSEPPDPLRPPPGCRFQKSCEFATDICRQRQPQLRAWDLDGDGEHLAACHHMEQPHVREALAAKRVSTTVT